MAHGTGTMGERIRAAIQMAFFALLIKPFMRLIMGIHVQGRHHLPETQCILVANHSSHLDTLVLMSLFPLRYVIRLRPVAAADYWTRSRLVYALTQSLFHILPIPRKGITPENHPLKRMEEAIQAGDWLIIYPEGTRAYGETLGPFKPGVAHLVRRYPELPVIPVYIRNTARILPRGQMLLVPFFVDVAIGPPLTFAPGTSKEHILQTLRDAVESLGRSLENASA